MWRSFFAKPSIKWNAYWTLLLWIRPNRCLPDRGVYIPGRSSSNTMIYRLLRLISAALEVVASFIQIVFDFFDVVPSEGNLPVFNGTYIALSNLHLSSLLFLLKRGKESRFILLICDICWEARDPLDRFRLEIEEFTWSLILTRQVLLSCDDFPDACFVHDQGWKN